MDDTFSVSSQVATAQKQERRPVPSDISSFHPRTPSQSDMVRPHSRPRQSRLGDFQLMADT